MIRHKYHAKPTVNNGIRFDSMKEADRYETLKILRDNGHVACFLRQVPFHLPGGVRYVCDFLVFWEGGKVTFEDVKGFRTESYKAKKKMVEDLYAPITITEI